MSCMLDDFFHGTQEKTTKLSVTRFFNFTFIDELCQTHSYQNLSHTMQRHSYSLARWLGSMSHKQKAKV